MNYLTPPAHNSGVGSGSGSGSNTPRMTSRSASPFRRNRANSLTPTQDTPDPSPLTSPQPLRKRPPRHTQLNEIFRPRCNTDPSRTHSSSSSSSSSSSNIKKSAATRSVLGSLLRQTLKVTTASVGFSASEERLTQLATTGSLSDNAKRKHSSSVKGEPSLGLLGFDL
ncbi:uncharacterized protein Dvir_GJ15990 [Drosophila virilis]|uniref:Uncharacterized protein n=1 Tax=Drosophila virilis TaxID=7244 RepID=B4MAW1_DROVI|nr:uncharacterized protein Dvir_GJ15990 [Drosophila virilis]